MHKTLTLILLCATGIWFNRLFATLATTLGLPLYLDTIMTITVTLLAGPVWGSLTGALTNIIALIFNFHGIEFLFFALCNIATAIITWVLMRLFPRELNFAYRKEITKKRYLLKSSRLEIIADHVIVLVLLSLTLTFAMSVLGGIIAYFIGIIRGASAHHTITAHLHMFSPETPLVLQEILSRVPVNIIDRIISVLIAYGIAFTAKPLFFGNIKHSPNSAQNRA